ncbi:alpha/beta fold hydrolase [Ornithinimicrobium sp. W1679]|uniref:alpha/beta fold hydrolase n=1 Tax=unclassified Ornithinimicrobium TaxID=2615080 RepID=UPI003CEC8805
MTVARVPVDGGVLEVRLHGDGPTLLLVQTALSTDEVAVLGCEPSLRSRHRVVDLRRRGYLTVPDGAPARAPGSVVQDAADCATVLVSLDASPAHVVGASYSGAVALELAAARPELVRTLTLLEPPPVEVEAGTAFRHASQELMEVFAQEGVTAALEAFTRVLGTDSWEAQRAATGADEVARVERDATVFFSSDVPALLTWRFGPTRAAEVLAPVLYVGGGDSGPWFAQVHDWVAELFPQAEHHVLPGADHLLLRTHTARVASLVADFLHRH